MEKKILFPSMKSKREFEEKFCDNFIFQWATINEDGTVEAHYKIKKTLSRKAVLQPSEKQLNLFVRN